IAALRGGKKTEPSCERQAVGQKFLGEIEPAVADDIGVDIPANPFRSRDAASKALGRNGMHSPPTSYCAQPVSRDGPEYGVRPLAAACELTWKVAAVAWLSDNRRVEYRKLPAGCCQGDRRAGNQGPRDPRGHSRRRRRTVAPVPQNQSAL